MQSTRSFSEERNITKNMALNVAIKYKTLLSYATFQPPAFLTWLNEKTANEEKRLLSLFSTALIEVLFNGQMPDVNSLDAKFRLFAEKKKAWTLTRSHFDDIFAECKSPLNTVTDNTLSALIEHTQEYINHIQFNHETNAHVDALDYYVTYLESYENIYTQQQDYNFLYPTNEARERAAKVFIPALSKLINDAVELIVLADDIVYLEYCLTTLHQWQIAIAEINNSNQINNTTRLEKFLIDHPNLAKILIDNIGHLKIIQQSLLTYINQTNVTPDTIRPIADQPPTSISATPMTLFSNHNPGQRLFETGSAYFDNSDYATASTLLTKAGHCYFHAPSLIKLAQIVKNGLAGRTDKLEASWHYFRAHLHATDADTQQQAFDGLLESYKALLNADEIREAKRTNPFYDSFSDLMEEVHSASTKSVIEKLCRLAKAYLYLHRLEKEHAQALNLPIAEPNTTTSFLHDAQNCYQHAHAQFLAQGAHKDDLHLLDNLSYMMENLEKTEISTNQASSRANM